jgi:hypothetical protein
MSSKGEKKSNNVLFFTFQLSPERTRRSLMVYNLFFSKISTSFSTSRLDHDLSDPMRSKSVDAFWSFKEREKKREREREKRGGGDIEALITGPCRQYGRLYPIEVTCPFPACSLILSLSSLHPCNTTSRLSCQCCRSRSVVWLVINSDYHARMRSMLVWMRIKLPSSLANKSL